MRNFWIVLSVLAVLAAWLAWPAEEDRPRELPASTSPLTASPTRVADPVAPSTEAAATDVADPETPDTVASDAVPAPTRPGLEAVKDPSLGPSTEPPPSEPEPTDTNLSVGLDREIPDATVIPGTIIETPEGTLLADDRYEVAGAGTEEDPYRISWELLVSAGEGYRPRVGDRGMPQRVAMLDGAWVEIEGYIAFPMLVGTATEGLVMLNRWDGCCIGVPPSPYDAIEVKLVDPVVRTTMHAIDYGTVTGKLSVSPYLVENWLVGLYLMDEATMKIDL